jgi:hypothetical protein
MPREFLEQKLMDIVVPLAITWKYILPINIPETRKSVEEFPLSLPEKC